MTDEVSAKLCSDLIHADSEDDVVKILKQAGYWDDPAVWRDLGDNENNFAAAGAQQSDSVAALVEKLVNSADARLMNACLLAGINPESKAAPQSVREGVARLIEKSPAPEKEHTGKMLGWTPTERNEQAKKITLCATGSRSSPSLTIVDEGEGQTPLAFPRTFMSLTKSNKLRVPFVQGKFNMGGTGALRFCGKRRLQLIVSRRNPALLTNAEGSDRDWGFTVVRRDEPTGGERSSVYRYLAPVAIKGESKRGVLHFESEALVIRPDGNKAYALPTAYGSLVKLYNYQLQEKSNILLGLAQVTDVRLPSPALPIMFHECRDYGGSAGSFSNPRTGLFVRLETSNQKPLDDAFPLDTTLEIQGQKLPIRFYGLKLGKAGAYIKSKDGVLFVVNGQTQGNLSTRFYRRNSIKLGAVADSLITIVDCSNLERSLQEELFMNNREALSNSEFRRDLERALERVVGRHPGLKEFNNRRRQEKLKSKLEEDQSLEDALKKVMRNSDILSKLFLKGERITNASDSREVDSKDEFVGKQFPTFFRHRGKAAGEELSRSCEAGRSARLIFETDAENSYFGRVNSPGRYDIEVRRGGQKVSLTADTNLYQGRFTVTLDPEHEFAVGEIVEVRLEVTDDTRLSPFVCKTKLLVKPKAEHPPAPPKPKPKNPDDKPGDKQLLPSGIKLPNLEWVPKSEWENHGFNKYSALKIERANDDKDGQSVYDFFLNEDNTYLQNYLVTAKDGAPITKKQYEVAMILCGLGMIYSFEQGGQKEADGEGDVSDLVAEASKGLALMIIPVIQQLGDLEAADGSEEAAPLLAEAA
jgi:hypothetical protein